MLSGVKFIPRDQVDKVQDEKTESKRKKSHSERKKQRKKKNNYSSSDDDVDKIRKRSKGKKKWYSSDEYSTSEDESVDSLEEGDKKSYKREKTRRSRDCRSEDDKKESKRGGKDGSSDDDKRSFSLKERETVRKDMGLEWMLRPGKKTDTSPPVIVDNQSEEPPAAEIQKVNPKELNPYFKNSGSGYPEEEDEEKVGKNQLPASSVVGDGGASWRLKALKRAKEQAAREGRRLEEVAEERWGSLGQLAVSASSGAAAPSRAHLHAINSRRKGLTEEHHRDASKPSERRTEKQRTGRNYLRDVSTPRSAMRAPQVNDSLSWGKRKSQTMSNEDAGLISAAALSLNKFSADGSFMSEMLQKNNNGESGSVPSHATVEGNAERTALAPGTNKPEKTGVVTEGLSANQLAAKAMQLRFKGKHEEAEALLQMVENMKRKQSAGEDPGESHNVRSISRYNTILDSSARKKDEDADMHLAQTIIQNKKFSISGQADDEYDYDGGPKRKTRKKGPDDSEKDNRVKRVLTQQERCLFCFENPRRPRHLVVSIANFTYLMLPQYQPVVPGHCCILTVQHEASSRSVDDNVWDEIRNFKKCLIMMFGKQEKEMVFLETVMGLAQQRRHCLIECIPLPREVAKQAPLYFKKAIDEAEDEWSQHNAKKLIDTSQKGLRNSIPKNFPYFHAEFGINKGVVHVIDDETRFNSSLGLNVIRGMLELPEEDMHRRRRNESMESQKLAVSSFVREWEPFDWTKQLG